MAYNLYLNIFVAFLTIQMTVSHLNLYIFNEDLKRDLNLEFGKTDIYLVTDGEPAPLLKGQNSFHELVAPIPSSRNKICFRWNSFPQEDHLRIKYTIKLTSSDIDIMPVPTTTIKRSDYVPLYEHDKSNFNVLFPCSGLKEGVVDLGFYLNYTAVGSKDERHLNIIVRRHCQKNSIHPDVSKNNNAKDAKPSSYNLVIGLSVAITILICILLFCFGNWQLQKRKRELEVKFDYDYELMVKRREDVGFKKERQDVNQINDSDMIEKEEDFVHKIETMPKPIFVPKKGQKLKNNKYSKNLKIWMDTLKLPYYSSGSLKIATHFGLEKIPEEETLLNERSDPIVNKNESSILSNDYAILTHSSDIENKNCLNSDNLETAVSIDKCAHPLQAINCEKQSDCIKSVNNSPLIHSAKPTAEPIYKKKHLKKAFDKPGEDKLIIDSIGTDTKMEAIFQYLNHKWMKQFQDCLLTPQQLIMGKYPLGKGATNNVHQGKIKELDDDENIKFTPVVIKTLVPTPEENNCMSKFINEALLIRKLKHKNIMNLVGVLLQPNQSPVIVIPFMKHADLNQFLRNARGTPKRHQTVSTRQLVNFGVQIACGMEYLASMKYVHRDLATRNCMLGEDLEVKISNLGLARDISKENYRMNKKTRLPIKWMAPESLTNFVFSEKSDVWSYGVVLWEIISLGKQPYSGLDNEHVQDFLMKGKRLERTQNCPEEFFHIMSLCWIQSPHDRPTFKQLYKEISTYEAKYQRYCIDYTTGSLPT